MDSFYSVEQSKKLNFDPLIESNFDRLNGELLMFDRAQKLFVVSVCDLDEGVDDEDKEDVVYWKRQCLVIDARS